MKPRTKSLVIVLLFGLVFNFSFGQDLPDKEKNINGAINSYLATGDLTQNSNIRLLSSSVSNNQITLNFNDALLQNGDMLAYEDIFSGIMNSFVQNNLLDSADMQIVTLINGTPINEVFQRQESLLPEVQADESGYTLTIPLPDESAEPRAGILSGRKIAISPGHGWVYNGSCRCYTLQRGYWYGINEDLVNAQIIMQLYSMLVNAGASVYPARNVSTTAGNGVTGRPKWQESARENLRAKGYPSSIWNTASTTDTDDDIRARPLFANYVKADMLISIHNNGGCNNNCGWNGGTMIMYDSANGYQSSSYRLAKAVESKLIPRLRSFDSRWRNRGVFGYAGNYGENRIATRPAIIVEAGFMDQQYPDNTFLQNATFRRLIAQGVYDGILEYYGLIHPVNSVTNGSFESGGTYTPTAWAWFPSAAQCSKYVYSTSQVPYFPAKLGARFLATAKTSTYSSCSSVYQDVRKTLQTGQKWTLSAWLRSGNSGTNIATLALWATGASGPYASAVNASLTNQWKCYQTTLTIQGIHPILRSEVYLKTLNKDVHVDDVRLTYGAKQMCPTSLTLNGGFETAGTLESEAQGWTSINPSGDGRQCNTTTKTFALDEACALQMTGTPENISAMKQVVKNPAVKAGDLLTLSASVMGENNTGGVIKAVVMYADGTRNKVVIPVPGGTYDYQALTNSIVLLHDVAKIKVKVVMDQTDGQFMVDDLQLYYSNNESDASLDSSQELLPLPLPLPLTPLDDVSQ